MRSRLRPPTDGETVMTSNFVEGKSHSMMSTMAETQEDVAARNEAMVLVMNAQHAREGGNRNYDGEEKRYKVWVDKVDPDRSKFGLEHSKYISTDAINSYYLQVQTDRCVQGRTAKKSIYALNKLALKEGCTHVLGGEAQSIEYGPAGAAIKAALRTIRSRYVDKRKAADDVFPQTDLPTNIISQHDQSIVLARVLDRHDASWADTASTWSVAANTLIRFESVKRVRLNRLKILNDLPPEGIETPHDTEMWLENVSRKSDGRILGIVLPPSDQLKKNKHQDSLKPEVVGGYRHKRYERCYHGIIAFVLLERLNEGQVISFLKKNRGTRRFSSLDGYSYLPLQVRCGKQGI